MDINNIFIENARASRSLPASIQVGKGTGVSRDERQESGKKKGIPFIPFQGDSVSISSGSGRAEISRDLLQFHVSFTKSRITIEEKECGTEKKVSPDIAAYEAQGIQVTDSKAVQEERSIGPYSLHVNQSAMKRYEQAGSYRNWYPTTFEITV